MNDLECILYGTESEEVLAPAEKPYKDDISLLDNSMKLAHQVLDPLYDHQDNRLVAFLIHDGFKRFLIATRAKIDENVSFFDLAVDLLSNYNPWIDFRSCETILASMAQKLTSISAPFDRIEKAFHSFHQYFLHKFISDSFDEQSIPRLLQGVQIILARELYCLRMLRDCAAKSSVAISALNKLNSPLASDLCSIPPVTSSISTTADGLFSEWELNFMRDVKQRSVREDQEYKKIDSCEKKSVMNGKALVAENMKHYEMLMNALCNNPSPRLSSMLNRYKQRSKERIDRLIISAPQIDISAIFPLLNRHRPFKADISFYENNVQYNNQLLKEIHEIDANIKAHEHLLMLQSLSDSQLSLLREAVADLQVLCQCLLVLSKTTMISYHQQSYSRLMNSYKIKLSLFRKKINENK